MTLTPRKLAFIQLALEAGALKFGEFTLKSGRISPYFFNAALFYTGKALGRLGEFYAEALIENQIEFQHLFGPAYKGLPLATTTAIALAHRGIDIKVSFNRKEVKDHGEGGSLIGAPLNTGGKTVIIDDVITAGTAFREAKDLIEAEGGNLSTVIIALDRGERGQGKTSTLAEIEAQGIKVLSLIEIHDLFTYLETQGETEKLASMQSYYQSYGV